MPPTTVDFFSGDFMKSLAVRVSGGCKCSRVGIHVGHEFLHIQLTANYFWTLTFDYPNIISEYVFEMLTCWAVNSQASRKKEKSPLHEQVPWSWQDMGFHIMDGSSLTWNHSWPELLGNCLPGRDRSSFGSSEASIQVCARQSREGSAQKSAPTDVSQPGPLDGSAAHRGGGLGAEAQGSGVWAQERTGADCRGDTLRGRAQHSWGEKLGLPEGRQAIASTSACLQMLGHRLGERPWWGWPQLRLRPQRDLGWLLQRLTWVPEPGLVTALVCSLRGQLPSGPVGVPEAGMSSAAGPTPGVTGAGSCEQAQVIAHRFLELLLLGVAEVPTNQGQFLWESAWPASGCSSIQAFTAPGPPDTFHLCLPYPSLLPAQLSKWGPIRLCFCPILSGWETDTRA